MGAVIGGVVTVDPAVQAMNGSSRPRGQGAMIDDALDILVTSPFVIETGEHVIAMVAVVVAWAACPAAMAV